MSASEHEKDASESSAKASPSSPKKKQKAPDYRIPEGSGWAGLWKVFAGVGGAGLALAAVGYATDPHRFAFSYLFAFICALTVALGSLFFIIVERLTSAFWSVSVRRIAEFFASGFPALVVLFIPVVISMGTLFPWLHEAPSEHEARAPLALIKEAHADETAAASHVPSANHVEGSHVAGPVDARPHHAPAAHAPHADVPAHARVGREEAPEEAHEAATLAKKAGFLNRNFFLLRVVLYFASWLLLSWRYFTLSTSQDVTKDPQCTRKAQSLAPIATILFGLSLTFAAFDWLMSLDPTWFSTIFGVTFFAGCVVTIFATLTVVTMALRADGLLKDAVTVEHFHDLGKLLFGFLVFWAYVSFSQFMLIWYAALPEETTFYHHRWDVGSWSSVSLFIVIAHFVIPFFLLISRNSKRRLPLLRAGAAWLLVMHVVEIYWLVLPNYNHGESTVSWIDGACLVGVVGVYLALVFRNMARFPLIPIGDPRLARSLSFENA